MSLTRQIVLHLGILSSILIAGCSSDKDKVFQDQTTPEWSYDQPFYVHAPHAATGLSRFDGPAPETYLAKRLIAIPRPNTSNPRKAPRTAIWTTTDFGATWRRAGYFGLQQRYFHLPVDQDGAYGVRFIGPGIPPAQCRPPKPHMIFHVDTQPPDIAVFITPNQEFYSPGEQITVEWQAADEHYKPESLRLGICLDSGAAPFKWTPLGSLHPRIGRQTLVIPDQAVHRLMKIRATAQDLAGNLGFGYSCPIPVVLAPPTATQPAPATQPATQQAKSGAKVIVSDTPQILTTMPEDYGDLETEKTKDP